ncbi:helix-turn-helix transcriptional regulator [Ensifer soli]|uniref:helix-turn-helix transcriptional regulator n=1 Tax=Ciceribacter sp. sgz301302 TaxID=3342379 RepID=UPI0035B6D397
MNMDVTTVIAAIMEATTASDCQAVFKAFLLTHDIDTFATGEVDLAFPGRNIFHAIDWPERWRTFYFTSGIRDHDPVLMALNRFSLPFTWADLRKDRGLSSAGTRGLQLVAEAGWLDGLCIHQHRGAERYGLVSLVSSAPRISAASRAALVATSLCFHGRMRRLVPEHGFPVPPAGLTARELDCLKRVAQGLTDKQIAAALEIGASTVHDHVEKARIKLSARSRAELAALSISLGIVLG